MIRAIGLVLVGLLASPVGAQQNQPETRERHLRIDTGEASDRTVTLDGILSYSRTGNRPPELSLDICFPPRPDLTSVDRLQAPVTVARNRMTASGRSMVGGLPVTVTIETKPGQNREPPTYKGEVTYGDRTITIPDQALDYQDGPAPEPYQGSEIVGSLSPNEVLATVPLGSVKAVLDIARRQKAILPPNQLVPGCIDLRIGKQVIRLAAGPSGIKPLAAALKAIPGSEVTEPANYTREDGIPLPANLKGAPEARIVQDFAETARTALGSTQAPIVRSRPESGDHVILVTRDTALARPLGLREVVVITVMVVPDAPAEKGTETVLYVMRVGSGFIDVGDVLTIQQDLSESTSYTDLIPGRASALLADAYAAKIGTKARMGSGRR